MTQERKIATANYGIIIGQAEKEKDIALLGLSSDLLKLANSYHIQLPQQFELHRVIPLGSLFFYHVELFDSQKFPNRVLLESEIGVGEVYRDSSKVLRLRRTQPIKYYRDKDGWLLSRRPITFTEKKHLFVTSINPTSESSLFLIKNSVVCSLGDGLPEIVPLKDNQTLGMINGDVRSVTIDELLYNTDTALVTKSNHFELEAKNSTVHSNALHLKSQRSRPLNPQPGTIIFNNRKKSFEGWDGTSWKTLKMED